MTSEIAKPAKAPAKPARIRSAKVLSWLRREVVLAPAGALLLAVVMTWPTMKHPAGTIPQDIYDPLLVAWILAWSGHAVLHQPMELWHANAFYPEPYSYAFTDSLFGYFPLALFGEGPVAAVVRYNLVYVLIPAVAFLGAYALARQLGARWPGAVVAGAAFAYAPWRLVQAGHLHVLSTGGIALTLAALARGHGYSFTRGYQRDEVRPGWAAAGWAAACWQLMIGFGVGLPFAYVLALVCLTGAVGWLVAGRPRLPASLLWVNGVGGIAFAATGLLMARPYLRVVELHPYARRGEQDLGFFSPPLRGFFTAPAEAWFWGERHAATRAELPFVPEMTLLPGLVVIVFAAAGVVLSRWSVRQRLALAALTVVSVVFAMGTRFFDGEYTYLLLFRHVPGWDALRTPGRLVVYTTLLLGLLAAGAVTAMGDRIATNGSQTETRPAKARSSRAPAKLNWPAWITAVALIPGALVLGEGVNTTPHPEVPKQPAALKNVTGPLLVLPSDPMFDQSVMLWSTDGFPKMANGGSGFYPNSTTEIRNASAAFPDALSVEYLRSKGIRTVVVLRDRIAGTPWQSAADKPVDGLPLRRTDTGGAVVFDLAP